jgi:hypothetical protein
MEEKRVAEKKAMENELLLAKTKLESEKKYLLSPLRKSIIFFG